KPLIAVTGATGLQGGSVARALLADGAFRVRALTRNPDAPTARELRAAGAEVVFADYADAPSLHAAFRGAHGVFGVTNFWESMSEAQEVREGTALVDAARACGVAHFVWSTVPAATSPPVPHWSSKARINAHLLASGVPRTSLHTTFYLENFLRVAA
ncbi:NmrA-like protein, partial [Phellopilus nigrolimitatus]